MVDVDGESQIFSEVFELAKQKGLEDGDDFSVQVVGVVELLLSIEGRYFFIDFSFFFMLIELLLVLM